MFYTVRQNNSGAYFLKDAASGVDKFVVIEAESSEQAKERFEAVREAYGVGFDQSCSCCGQRWYSGFYDEDATDTPDRAADTYVHYLDGRIVAGLDVILPVTEDEYYASYPFEHIETYWV